MKPWSKSLMLFRKYTGQALFLENRGYPSSARGEKALQKTDAVIEAACSDEDDIELLPCLYRID